MNQRLTIYLLIAVALILMVLYFFPPYKILNKLKPSQTVESVVTSYHEEAIERLGSSFNEFTQDLSLLEISFLVFKEERVLELYAKGLNSNHWVLIKTYPFTAFSGTLGPKLKEGDKQIPEGIYEVESLNPNSSYHLSLRVNYPNAFDKKMALQDGRTDLGGDIMIHGKDVTIGCVPIGDEAIEELFVLSAKTIKNSIPIIIAPLDFRKHKRIPMTEKIDWEEELYEQIELELIKYI